ncbi:hypothetical protein [Stackebrandtia nassauensis]|uniref:Transmembrane protein n=1 Tax=Stackebrandtia nassauensis (strain DSM 44728 / CIP 108903 / NRRL B-16338 / NBRC 102104 / LLR-40K-21) TaxID=446470 RepID=D3PZ43_STANL|nr:hypothetical protein [Stackebrandtia nassauensis]ADD45472.1 hypothetical protein Snas_5843 [Stackebrandtia nassauensis DSM 44728]
MYEDNAWPDTAPIQTFIPERKRPQRVFIAGMATLTAAGAALLAGLLHLAVAETRGGSFLVDIPGVVMVVLGLAVAAWLGLVAQAVLKGRKWIPKPAMYSGGGLLVFFGLIGLLAKPGPAVGDGAFGLWLYAILAFLAAVAGVTTAVCLLGRNVAEYFDPPAQPSPFQQNNNQAPMGGYDSDWIPPQQRGRPQPPFTS